MYIYSIFIYIYIYIYILHIFRCITCFFCKSLHSRNSACSTPKLLISVFMTSDSNEASRNDSPIFVLTVFYIVKCFLAARTS